MFCIILHRAVESAMLRLAISALLSLLARGQTAEAECPCAV